MTNDNSAAEKVRRALRADRVLLLFCAAFFLILSLGADPVRAASQCRTQNFIVTAPNADLANRVAQCAEESRVRLARLWLGIELQPWTTPCPIKVKCGPNMGAGGETTFTFVDNTVTGWKMSVQGTEERILDSVIPHEVSHTIFATYFCCPVPRWIDEGAATSVEADVERNNYRSMLIGFLQENRGIPFNTMVRLTEYPNDMMPFYSQGFSVCEYLIAVGGHRRLMEFAHNALETGNWSESVKKYYGYNDLSDLQIRWTNWVSAWHNAGHPRELPEVVRINDYPYDIYGRRIGSPADGTPEVAAAAGAEPLMTASVNPLNSFVAMPRSRYDAEDEDFTVSFNDGVGSALPSVFSDAGTQVAAAETAPFRGSNVYHGTYGHRQFDTSAPGAHPHLGAPGRGPAPPLDEVAQADPYSFDREFPPMAPPPLHPQNAPYRGPEAPTILGQTPF
ncbi:MAG: hypothetical protein IJG60_00560 [Thermoguttaceae bacterium]|nr:hypothetical protein [Thermoguttaceae bacterium]